MTTLQTAVPYLAAALAGFTQGFSGFGSTVVALPLLGAVMGMQQAVPLGCLMALTINVLLTARLRAHVNRFPLGMLLLSALPGMALGAVFLGAAPEALLKALLGLGVLLFALSSFRAQPSGGPANPGWAVPAGFLSGCLGVCIGINGPPVVAWAARQSWPRDAFKATLTSYFLLAGIGIVGTQALHGRVNGPVLGLYVSALPPLLAGLWFGYSCSGKLGERTFRRIMLVLVACMGALLLRQAGVAYLAG